jgi:hypothetical protein
MSDPPAPGGLFKVYVSPDYLEEEPAPETFDDREDAILTAEKLAGKLGCPFSVIEVNEDGEEGAFVGEFDPEDGWRFGPVA